MILKNILLNMCTRHLYFHKRGLKSYITPLQFTHTNFYLTRLNCASYNFNRHIKTHQNGPKKHVKADEELYKSKHDIVSRMNFESDLHSAPFFKLPIHSLLQIYKTTKNDESNGFCKNRLYYIASHLNCPPSMLSERLVKRTFIYSLSFEWIENSLKVLLEMGVSRDRILRDLWVLKYQHTTIQCRLQQIKDLDVHTLYPWMVRCSEDILSRYIEIYKQTKSILGENASTQTYIARRLCTNLDVVEEMYAKVPALDRIRVTKVKSVLDFLFAEGYTVDDIISKPRVFSASQKTVKQRLEKLRELGLTQINLNVLCRSRKGFKRYYESIVSINKE